MTGTFWVYTHLHRSSDTNRKSGCFCDMNNNSPRLETQDSKHISQTYFPFLVGSRLLFLWAFLHFSCFFSLSIAPTQSARRQLQSTNGCIRGSQRQFLPLLLSPPCDSRATEAISWLNQSPQPSLSMTCKKSTTVTSTAQHTHVAMVRNHGWVRQNSHRQWGNETCGQQRSCFWAWEGGISGTVSPALSSSTVSAALGNQGNTPCNRTRPYKNSGSGCSSCSTNNTRLPRQRQWPDTSVNSTLFWMSNVGKNNQAAITDHVPGLQCPVQLTFWISSWVTLWNSWKP